MAEKKPILLRIPHELWEQLQHWAEDDLRSLNGQIEFILREAARKRTGRALKEPGEPDAPSPSQPET